MSWHFNDKLGHFATHGTVNKDVQSDSFSSPKVKLLVWTFRKFIGTRQRSCWKLMFSVVCVCVCVCVRRGFPCNHYSYTGTSRL